MLRELRISTETAMSGENKLRPLHQGEMLDIEEILEKNNIRVTWISEND